MGIASGEDDKMTRTSWCHSTLKTLIHLRFLKCSGGRLTAPGMRLDRRHTTTWLYRAILAGRREARRLGDLVLRWRENSRLVG